MPGVPVRLSVTARPGMRADDEKGVPINGTITNVVIQVPEGCQNLVETRLYVNGDLVAPGDGTYLRGNGIVWNLSAMRPVALGDRILLIVSNHDGRFPHTVEAVVNIEAGPPPQYGNAFVLASESIGPPQALPGARTVLGPYVGVPPQPPSFQPNPAPYVAAQAPPPPPSQGTEQFQLAQQAIFFLGIAAIGLTIAVIFLSMGGQKS